MAWSKALGATARQTQSWAAKASSVRGTEARRRPGAWPPAGEGGGDHPPAASAELRVCEEIVAGLRA